MNLVPWMTTGSCSSTPNVRGMGMKKKSEDQGYLIVANGGGAQHTGSGDNMDGIIGGSCYEDKIRHGVLPARVGRR